jgi:hypothetical protein
MLTIEEQREVQGERKQTVVACNRFDKTIELTADCNDDETSAYDA